MFKIEKNPKKVIICGTGSGWELMPQNTDYLVYALNDYVYKEKYGIEPDLLFIMDILDEKPQVVGGLQKLDQLINKINSLKIPLIAPYKYAEIPLSQAYPLKEVIERFGMPYFTNTIAYMIAYALLRGVEEIQLYGVNQASSSEYFYEKAGVEYWLGVANGMGVKITINGERSEVLANKKRFGGNLLYGYNMTADEYEMSKIKFGVNDIKKLIREPKEYSKTIRKII